MLKISFHLSPFFHVEVISIKPACKILIFRLFSHCFNDVVNLNNIIALSNDFKIGYFVGLAVKFAYDAGVVSTVHLDPPHTMTADPLTTLRKAELSQRLAASHIAASWLIIISFIIK